MMSPHFGHARLEELKLLAEIDQKGTVTETPVEGPRHDMLKYLVAERLVNYLDISWTHDKSVGYLGLPGESLLERRINEGWLKSLSCIFGGEEVQLKLTHWGRVRLSELKQALRAGREREPFGILCDVRRWQQDLQIAILDAEPDSPVALAYLDINGLKQVNDDCGHDAGDRALKTFFQTVATVFSDRGQAYRLGGDEVLVVLPNHDTQTTVGLLQLVCARLMHERLEQLDETDLLSIAAGVIASSDASASPEELRSAADKVQYRAKEQSRRTTPRPSVIAIDGQEDMIVIKHDATPDSQSGSEAVEYQD